MVVACAHCTTDTHAAQFRCHTSTVLWWWRYDAVVAVWMYGVGGLSLGGLWLVVLVVLALAALLSSLRCCRMVRLRALRDCEELSNQAWRRRHASTSGAN